MKISIFIGSLKGGGAEKTALFLANHLSQNHTVEIIQVTNYMPDDFVSNANINIISLDDGLTKNNKLFRTIEKIKRLKKILRENRTDVYIGLLPENIELLLFYRRIHKKPVIFSERSNPRSYSLFHKVALRFLSRKADGAVFQTEGASRWYKLPKRVKSIIVPNALNGVCATRPINYNSRRIVSVGRLEKEKNYPLLIKAFATLKTEFPDLELTIYGEGSLRNDLESLCTKLHLSNCVFLPGYSNNIFEEISKHSIFVLPSRYEGMSNSLAEAMACSLACVATDCPLGGNRYLLDNGNGVLVKTNDVASLCDGIREFLLKPDYAKGCGTKAKAFIEKITPEKTYNKWENLILEVTKG